MTELDVLLWGHARREALRKLHRAVPPYIAAIESEYQHRRWLRRRRAALRATEKD